MASGNLAGNHVDEIAACKKDQAGIIETQEFECRIEALERPAGQEREVTMRTGYRQRLKALEKIDAAIGKRRAAIRRASEECLRNIDWLIEREKQRMAVISVGLGCICA